MVKFKEAVFGTKAKNKKLDTLTSGQKELMDLISQGLTSGEGAYGDLFSGFNEQEFEKGVTEPALKNFKEKILPTLQEKFIANNQIGGSGLEKALVGEGTDLQSKLAALKYQAMQDQNKQAQQNKLAASQLALGTKGFENLYTPATSGAIHNFAEGAGKGLGLAAGTAIAG